MLRVENLAKDFGGLQVLRGVTFNLGPGERLGLVGRNGAGKSTLLRLIAGLEEPDRGQVSLLSGASLAYLPQDARPSPGRTVHDEALGGFADVLALEARQRALEAEMAAAGDRPAQLMRLVEQHAHVREVFEQRGGYRLEAEVGRVLAGLGFSQDDHARLVEHLSGGWRMRVALARLLVQRPGVLLLDEPTNHLDLAAIEWLESYLVQYPGAVLLVSHDRYLLNAVVGRYLELEDGQGAEYVGSYSAYVSARDQRHQAQRVAYTRQQALIARQQTFIDRNRAGQRHAQARSREKLLERLEPVEQPREADLVRFRFPPCHRGAREVAVLKGASKSYGARVVLDGLNLAVERDDRIALVGPNGAGKSTLLRLLAQREAPTRGSLRLGQHLAASHYAQDHVEELGTSGTVLDEVERAASGWTREQVRGLLGQLLFSQDDALKPLATLSGGERARVLLAKLLLRPSNLLLLDEPSNHLDVATSEAFEAALRAYPGTLVFATHDRYLVEQLATKVWEVADGGVRPYLGNYSAYRRKREAERRTRAASPTDPAQQDPRSVGACPTPGARRGTSPHAADRDVQVEPLARRKARPDRALERELARVEQRVDELVETLARLELALADPSSYGDAQQAAELGLEHASCTAELEALTQRWEELASAQEATMT
ncbi:MAG: ABC-F family ATP-binding cassette domain-containing protein [Chloroflexi bacterium]|nr:ABC-F family ATP-binding cassette domain-containing protein [Chloroflexota bacterium]